MKQNIVILFVTFALFTFAETSWTQSSWARVFGLTGEDRPECSAPTSDGGVILAGTIDTSSGTTDIWILKLHSSGDIEWQKSFGGDGFDYVKDVLQTSMGGIIVVGSTSSSGAPSDFWVIMLNSAGEIQWEKTYDGMDSDEAIGVVETTDGQFYVVGRTSSFAGGNLLLKIDNSGLIEWQKIFGTLANDIITSLAVTSGGDCILGGHRQDGATTDILLMNINGSGDIQWQKTYSEDFFQIAISIEATNDSGVIVVGDGGQSDGFVMKLDSFGVIQWKNTYGGNDLDKLNSVRPTADGGYLVGGTTYSFGAGSGDFWILKLDSLGNIQWQKTYGDSTSEFVQSVTISNSRYYIFGQVVTTPQNSDFVVLKLDVDGSISSCTSLGDSNILPSDFNAVMSDMSATVSEPLVITNSTSILPSDTNATEIVQCETVCLFCDDFEDNVVAIDWTYGNGAWSESNGVLSGSDSGKDTAIANPVFAEGCVTCSVSALMNTNGGSNNRISLYGWYVDKKNHVELTLREERDKLIFKQKVNGRIVLKQSLSFEILPNQFYAIQISFDGTQFQVTVDGVEVLSVDPSTVPLGTVGFAVKNTTGTFQEIVVN